jgi:outer membrane protein assembly factor BamB
VEVTDSLTRAGIDAIDSTTSARSDAPSNGAVSDLVDTGIDNLGPDVAQELVGEDTPLSNEVVGDDDSDGIVNALDNCVSLANPDQKDFDGDDLGDLCDDDDDGDGDPDVSDCAPLDSSVHHGATEECNGIDDDCDGQFDNGGLLWEFDSPGGASGGIVLLPNGNIGFSTGQYNVYYLTQDGELVVEIDTPNQVISDMAVSDGPQALFYPVLGGNVVAADMDGSELWGVEPGGPAGNGLAYRDNVVVGSTINNQVFALDEVSGALQWQVELPDAIMSAPAIGSDGSVFIGCNDNALYSLNGDGILWSVSTGNEVWSTPGVGSDGTIYFGSNDGWFYAVKSSGATKWAAEVGGQIWGKPLLTDGGHVYVSSTSNRVTKLSAAFGETVWSTKVGSISNSSLAEGPLGNIYVVTTNGQLFCIDSAEGDILWSFQAASSIHGSPLVVGNRLFATAGTKVIAICLAGQ